MKLPKILPKMDYKQFLLWNMGVIQQAGFICPRYNQMITILIAILELDKSNQST